MSVFEIIGLAFWKYVLRTIKRNLWKSDIPVSEPSEFQKHFGWFVYIRSMQAGLSTPWKHVGSLMRDFKLHDAQNCSKKLWEISVFKPPRIIELPYFEE